MNEDRKTRSVKVNKAKLLERLKSNREKHEGEFSFAFDAYCKKVSAGMLKEAERLREFSERVLDLPRDERLDGISGGYLMIPRPEDHTIDYDRAIDRIEWEEEEVVCITEDDFNCYIRDEWQWRDRFRTTHRAVTG